MGIGAPVQPVVDGVLQTVGGREEGSRREQGAEKEGEKDEDRTHGDGGQSERQQLQGIGLGFLCKSGCDAWRNGTVVRAGKA